jgi:hypothetical protein
MPLMLSCCRLWGGITDALFLKALNLLSTYLALILCLNSLYFFFCHWGCQRQAYLASLIFRQSTGQENIQIKHIKINGLYMQQLFRAYKMIKYFLLPLLDLAHQAIFLDRLNYRLHRSEVMLCRICNQLKLTLIFFRLKLIQHVNHIGAVAEVYFEFRFLSV